MHNAKRLLTAVTLAAVLTVGCVLSVNKTGKQAGNFGGPIPICSPDNPCPH